MQFFYPNYLNDMWRIVGLLFKDDRDAFVDAAAKRFKMNELVAFLTERGIAVFDTASAVRRLQGNASDKFLEIVTPTDVSALLREMPQCHVIAATGGKAAEELAATLTVEVPAVGEAVSLNVASRCVSFFRMPSTSRAYPMKLEKKATYYHRLFAAAGLLEPVVP